MTSVRSLALALAIALGLPGATAVAADSAAGHYRMGDQRFEVKHGVAVHVWKDAERETFGVVLGEGPFNPEAAVGALDPIDAIAESAPRNSGVMLLTIRPGLDGPLEIASLIARPDSFSTNGSGDEQITVDGDRIRGEWVKPSTEFSDKTYEMTVRFDLPLTAIDDPGTPLPADGGEPGKAYRAFVEAVGKRDGKAVMARSAMPADMAEMLGEESLLEIAAMNHPASPEILGGWIDGDRAQLRVRGKHSFGQTIRGRVEVVKVDGVWKVGDSALR